MGFNSGFKGLKQESLRSE